MKTLLLGKDGQVGWELQRALAPLGELVAFGSQTLDIADSTALRTAVRKTSPDVIVNAAAYTAVDKAETETEQARRVNTDAVAVLAEEASRTSAWLVHYSTDYVFDGTKPSPYVEEDPTRPLSVYGSTKLEGEEAIRKRHARHLIFRTSWVYGVRGTNFPKTMLRLAKEREALRVVADQHGAPTSAELIADVTALTLYRLVFQAQAANSYAGTYHLAASGETTWCEYARYVLRLAIESGAALKCQPGNVEPIPAEAYPAPAARPKNSRLDAAKLRRTFGISLPDWRYHVTRMVNELHLQGTL
jgi:dTDP-4-dehydrorhamnose reductase